MIEGTRKNWIDAAKGYGMILVILGHITEYSPVGMIIYSFHMPLFFFLSGYLFSTKRSFGDFACNKTRRLIIPYFAYAVPLILWDAFALKGKSYWQYAPVFDGVKLLSIDSYGGTYDWESMPTQGALSVILRDVLGIIIQKRMWTHWYLACLILLCFLSYFLFKYIKQEWIRLSVIMILTAGGFLFYFAGGKAWIWNADVCSIAISFFYAGYLSRKYHVIERLLDITNPIYILIASIILNLAFCGLNIMVSGYGLDMYDCDYGMIPFMYIAAFSGTAAVILSGYLFSISYIRWVGRHSMVFFIFHQVVCIPLFEGMLSKLGILQEEGIVTESLHSLIILAFTCATLSGIVYLLETLLVRIKIVRLT